MSIKAKYNKQAGIDNIEFGRTIIDWDRQRLVFNFLDHGRYEHKLTETQWNYLTTGLQSLMGNIPNISDIVMPEFDPDMK